MDKHQEQLNQLDKSKLEGLKRTELHVNDTMQWLKSRHGSKAKLQYLFFPEELHKHYEINELFRGFDADQSDGIEISELIKMFKDNNMHLDPADIQAIFKLIDFNGDNTLNLSEFKKSVFSDQINTDFAKLMRNFREKLARKEIADEAKRNRLFELSFAQSKSPVIPYVDCQQNNQQQSEQLMKHTLKVDDSRHQTLAKQTSINTFNNNPENIPSMKEVPSPVLPETTPTPAGAPELVGTVTPQREGLRIPPQNYMKIQPTSMDDLHLQIPESLAHIPFGSQAFSTVLKSQIDTELPMGGRKERAKRVVPSTFANMVEYFSFNFQRKEQLAMCKKMPSKQASQKANALSKLMDLSSKFTGQQLSKIYSLNRKYKFHSFSLLEDEAENNVTNKTNNPKVNAKVNDSANAIPKTQSTDVPVQNRRPSFDTSTVRMDQLIKLKQQQQQQKQIQLQQKQQRESSSVEHRENSANKQIHKDDITGFHVSSDRIVQLHSDISQQCNETRNEGRSSEGKKTASSNWFKLDQIGNRKPLRQQQQQQQQDPEFSRTFNARMERHRMNVSSSSSNLMQIAQRVSSGKFLLNNSLTHQNLQIPLKHSQYQYSNLIGKNAVDEIIGQSQLQHQSKELEFMSGPLKKPKRRNVSHPTLLECLNSNQKHSQVVSQESNVESAQNEDENTQKRPRSLMSENLKRLTGQIMNMPIVRSGKLNSTGVCRNGSGESLREQSEGPSTTANLTTIGESSGGRFVHNIQTASTAAAIAAQSGIGGVRRSTTPKSRHIKTKSVPSILPFSASYRSIHVNTPSTLAPESLSSTRNNFWFTSNNNCNSTTNITLKKFNFLQMNAASNIN